MRRFELVASILIGIVLLGLGLSYSVGWFVGCFVVVVIRWNRNRFYNQIMDMTKFNVVQYIAYTVTLLALMGGSFMIAFLIQSWVNPYTLFSAFFAERIFLFFSNILSKGGNNNVSK